jgi:hypothetical protein
MSLTRTGSRYPAKPKTQVTTGRTVFGFLVAVLLVASGVMWAVLFFGPLAHLARLANGLAPFDIRPKGYSYAEARAFLEAIGEQGGRYYASPELSHRHVLSAASCGVARTGVVVANDARARA